MKQRIADEKLRRFYRLMSVKMIDFDCGELCAPANNGIPRCCENEYVVPVLFREEYDWHRRHGGYWKRIRAKTKAIKKFIEESASYYVFAECPGPGECRRSKRALTCMTYPFEPHVDKHGDIIGMAFSRDAEKDCPLAKQPKKVFNPRYIANSIVYWNELFEVYSGEKETYMKESRKRERRAKQRNKRVRLYKPGKAKAH